MLQDDGVNQLKYNFVGLTTLILHDISRMFRVSIQSIFTPLIIAGLYIFIFGEIIGKRVGNIGGIPYIDFVLPGVILMNIIFSSFTQSSSSIFLQRFTRTIDEVLVSPLSYFEIIIGFAIGGVVRGLLVGLGTYAIALFFTSASVAHFLLFLFYAICIALIFSFLGMIIGLWSNHFEHLMVLSTFVITPLVFLGGVFHSVSMLPESMRTIARLNPFFYFVDGMRFSMIGFGEASLRVGIILTALLVLLFGAIAWRLFKIGYKIKS